LYSIVQFVDGWRLGPGFRFFNKHRVVDEKGKVLGYKNLGELGKPRLTITLPDRTALDNLAHTLAQLLAVGSPTGP
jgi:hypothetical protein